jgi:hypothetical protein
VSAELPWATVAATSPYADEEEDRSSFPVTLHQSAAGDLQALLERDTAAARGPSRPETAQQRLLLTPVPGSHCA